MKLKNRSTIAKRFEIKKSGKILKRYRGQNHFNSRDRGVITRKKRRDVSVSASYERAIKSLVSKP